jgi:hypothetical protein
VLRRLVLLQQPLHVELQLHQWVHDHLRRLGCNGGVDEAKPPLEHEIHATHPENLAGLALGAGRFLDDD